jgi:hypothetical protein
MSEFNFNWGKAVPRLGAYSGSGYNSPSIQTTGFDASPLTRADSFGAAQPAGNWWSNINWFDRTDNKTGIKDQGMFMPALGAAQGLANVWMGMKQYGLGKKTLAENKRQFGLNFDAQMRTTNAALEDRQRARVASNPGAYQSVGEYMNKNAIKGG